MRIRKIVQNPPGVLSFAWLGLMLLSLAGLSQASHMQHPHTDALSGSGFVHGDAVTDEVQENIRPIPLSLDLNARKVALGLRLFDDKRLSANNSLACRNCHYLDKGGTDGERFSPAIDGGYRSRNTPSIFNVGLLGIYGWYGSPSTLEDVAEGIIKSKQGMASDWPEILVKLNQDSQYVGSFKAIYSDGIKPENIKNALGEYMRSLITPNSRFDQYLRGNQQAITDQEKRGYSLFKQYGCSSCHQGVTVGGNMVAPFNLFRNYLTPENTALQIELGRYNQTEDEGDKYVFRVPSLRNVALTAPYFHDGSTNRLETAVDQMGRYMLGREIPKQDRELIVQFLHTLTGTYQGKPLQDKPILGKQL